MWADGLKSFAVSMANAIGLGSVKDRSEALAYAFRVIPPEELIAMHRSDWLSRKIVDIIPNDMTREWRDWQAEKPQIEAIEKVEKAPQVALQLKANAAIRRARLLGGAGIYIGIKGARPEEELDVERVRKDDLEYLHVLGKDEVTVGPVIRDVLSPFYGEPEHYELRSADGKTTRVHPSRMVRFLGADVIEQRGGLYEDQWGDSILQVVYDALRNASSAQGHIAALIPELKTDIIYIPGLSDAIRTAEGEAAITKRFQYAHTMRSMFSLMLLEGNGGAGQQAEGERWEQKQINFAQMPELMQQYLQIAAGAADIPITRLLGQSPSGMNATGESDTRNYYDNVAARQRMELAPQLHRLDEVVIRSALGTRPPEIHYRWAPLWGLSEKDKAEVFERTASAARKILGTGQEKPLIALEPLSKSVANRLVEDGVLPGLDEAIDEYGGTLEEEPSEEEIEAAAGLQREPAPVERLRTAANDAEPRPLYVHRRVKNGRALIAWAKSQGFTSTLDGSDLHVTICFSRQPIDWMAVGESWEDEIKIGQGGPRVMEQFGDATVLLIPSRSLKWRHREFIEAGASWDHEDYQPHITISYGGAPADLSKVAPYQGEIILGPEVFEPLDEDWRAKIAE